VAAVAAVSVVAALASVRVQADVSEQILMRTRFMHFSDSVIVLPPTGTAIDRARRTQADGGVGRNLVARPAGPASGMSASAFGRVVAKAPSYTVPLVIGDAPQTPQTPVVVTKVDPVYTQAALDRRIQGDVDLELTVTPDGHVGLIKVTHSLDRTSGLDDEAIRAARQWVFRTDGSSSQVSIVMEFRLAGQHEVTGTSTYVPRPLADAFANGAYAASALGVVPPKVISIAKARYTPKAMRDKLTGTVELEIVILADGTVGNARVMRSLDAVDGLDEQALAAARASTFEPGLLVAPGSYEGRPIAVVANLNIVFTLH
jgi:TonB family protein